ncbi:MAG: hypothetical protein JO356_20870 [Acidobacteria bacterium]|nr:hypothetical protein [Acidobacteriota bacterium]
MRQLLRSLALSGDDVDAFISATGSVHVLRNRTDRLDQRIPNIAASKFFIVEELQQLLTTQS